MSSKRYKKLPVNTLELKPDSFENLIDLVKKNSTTKFDESIDINFQINNKQKKGEVNLRTMVNMPSGTGKKVKIAVICEESMIDDAKKAGADLVGADSLIEEISSGKINFEKLICTPSMMIKLSKVGKILGPKGLMPNPKLGTVTVDVRAAVEAAKSGQIQYRAEKTGIVQAGVGKISFGSDKLVENANSFIETIQKSRPTGAKGTFIKKISISSTMGVGININI